VNRHALIHSLQAYQTIFNEEQTFVSSFLHLLKSPDCFQRTHLPGHLTGSAWILNADSNKVLLVHHAKLNRWMQPGGHADGDENILQVALKEAREETGIVNFRVNESIFDIDIHTIPARKDIPEHLHYDVRFLVHTDEAEKIIVSEESHDVKWVSFAEIEKFTTEPSILRMKAKINHG